MPEPRVDSNLSKEKARLDMDHNQKGGKMVFSGTRSLLLWCRQQTEGYSDVNVYNLTTSWRDGLGFCAIIHRFRPDLIDFERLSKENILENNELAFSIAEKYLGIPVVLDASDMMENPVPDKLSVITYVSQLYDYFKNKSPANQSFSTKMNMLPKTRVEATSNKGNKRTSPSQQIYTLSGHAKRMATALRNVFRSDTKEDMSKNKELDTKYMGLDPLRRSTDTNKNSDEILTPQMRMLPFLGTHCFVCHQKVYIMERLIVERKLFHRSCFRCDKCHACLRSGTYHYRPETETFCCLFDCTRGHGEKPIKVKLDAMADTQLYPSSGSQSPSIRTPFLSVKNSKNLQPKSESSLQRQFSVVKRNAITIRALPQKLNQGQSSVFKTQKQPWTHTSTTSAHKNEGDKKRRISSNGKSDCKRENKVKSGQVIGPVCEGIETRNSLSPVNKRRATGSYLLGAQTRVLNIKESIKVDSSSGKKSPKGNVIVNGENKSSEEFNEKPFALKKKEMSRSKEEASGNKTLSMDLSLSFKEELLKRATETSKNECKVENCSGCENFSEEVVSTVQEKNYCWDANNENFKEQESVTDNITADGAGLWNGSCLEELVEPPIPPRSVQLLREKFLNINDMIDTKHKHSMAKKQSEMHRELNSIVAWKKQADSSCSPTKKWSTNETESSKDEISCGRKSVKELRKMYMRNAENDNKDTKKKSSSVQLRSVSTIARNRQESSKCSKVVVPHLRGFSAQDKRIENETYTKVEANFSESSPSDVVVKESEQNANHDYMDLVTVINIDQNSEERVGSETNAHLISSDPFGKMSHQTQSYTIIKSEGILPSNSPLPSFEIQQSSPELPHGKPSSPSHTDLQISSLKGHAASRDSGIDMPPSSQSTCLDITPGVTTSTQTCTELEKLTVDISCLPNDKSVGSIREHFSSETGSDFIGSDCPWSLTSDHSPEVFWSRPWSVGSGTSCTESNSSCSSPRMSIVIAQEASTTKINSRFFTVETTDSLNFEDRKTLDQHQCVMEIEGEFRFGRENRKTSRAERDAIISLHREAKTSSSNSCDLIKEEEITLSPVEIESELQSLEAFHAELVQRGIRIEQCLRENLDSERPCNDTEDELLQEWLAVVQERNIALRRESELIYLLQSQNYEERYRIVEGELRKLVAMRDEVKSSDDVKRERELLSELLELVQKRSFIVDNLEEDRVREIQEDEKIEQALIEGISAFPGNCWDQTPDCTKVAFSRFYC